LQAVLRVLHASAGMEVAAALRARAAASCLPAPCAPSQPVQGVHQLSG
jgi:hypothetical protein